MKQLSLGKEINWVQRNMLRHRSLDLKVQSIVIDLLCVLFKLFLRTIFVFFLLFCYILLKIIKKNFNLENNFFNLIF